MKLLIDFDDGRKQQRVAADAIPSIGDAFVHKNQQFKVAGLVYSIMMESEYEIKPLMATIRLQKV